MANNTNPVSLKDALYGAVAAIYGDDAVERLRALPVEEDPSDIDGDAEYFAKYGEFKN